jgi:hypothetical protein
VIDSSVAILIGSPELYTWQPNWSLVQAELCAPPPDLLAQPAAANSNAPKTAV